MSTVGEIKAAIQKLPPADQSELVDWMIDWADDAWDRQIKADISAGRLDKKLDQVRADIRAGNVREMP
jgi:hypothetical protein